MFYPHMLNYLIRISFCFFSQCVLLVFVLFFFVSLYYFILFSLIFHYNHSHTRHLAGFCLLLFFVCFLLCFKEGVGFLCFLNFATLFVGFLFPIPNFNGILPVPLLYSLLLCFPPPTAVCLDLAFVCNCSSVFFLSFIIITITMLHLLRLLLRLLRLLFSSSCCPPAPLLLFNG